jgi:hypothetical protein
MLFPQRCLQTPKRGNRHRNLSGLVIQQVANERDPPGSVDTNATKKHTPDLSDLARRVSIKLEEGDVMGAIRLASSEDSIVEEDNSTIAALVSKHPPPYPETVPVPPPDDDDIANTLVISEQFLHQVLRSFPSGSAGGPDGLHLQHLLDLRALLAGDGGVLLIQALARFVNLVLANGIPVHLRPYFLVLPSPHLTKRMEEYVLLQWTVPYAVLWLRQQAEP